LIFAALKLAPVKANPSPIYTGDGRIWASIAQVPLREILLQRRPPLYPLLFKTGLSDQQVIACQVGLGIGSWLLLAYALSRFVPGVLRAIVFGATLLLPLVTPVNAWDIVIRAESTSNSALVVAIAFALLFSRSLRSMGKASYLLGAATAISATLLAFSRDASSYLVPLLSLFVLLAAGLTRRCWEGARAPRLYLLLALTVWLNGAALGAQHAVRVAPRYDFPLMNVIFKRILPDAAKREYFAHELGMPMSSQLMRRARTFASSNHRQAYRDPALEPFRIWLFTKGYQGYQRYLLSHLKQTSLEAYADFVPVVGYMPGREGRATATALTVVLDEWLVRNPLSSSPLLASIVFFLLGAVASIHPVANVRILGAASVCLVLATLSQLFICYHGDAMEVARHSVVVGILFRLELLVSTLLAVSLVARGVGYLRSIARFERSPRAVAE
jgi:hypothetical protein